jgi:mono/diheme cytochrome c family protein
MAVRNRIAACAALALAGLLSMAGCSKGDAPPAPGGPPRAASGADGEALYAAHCMRCHGEAGTGTDHGPPLVHRIYEPGHHPDAAFYRAAASGVRAHHWRFGDMPAIGGVSNAEVTAIIGYVRRLQREAGIF